MPRPLTPSQTLAPVMANIPSLTLTGPFLTLHLHAPRNVLPPPRVALPMAQYMAAGQAPNWSLPSTPYSVGTTICYVCLDQDFIDRSRHCGMVTDWQLIFGTLDAYMFRARAPATSPNFCRMHRAFLRTASPSPLRSPVLSESPPISGSDLPGQAKSPISCISESLLGVLPLFPRLRASAVFALHCFVRCFGCLLLGFAGSFFSSLLGRMVEWLPSSPFIRRWSRHRHKRIRGIGSQAASRRCAKSRRLALSSKAHPFSILARVSQWTQAFRLNFRLSHTSRQRSAVWQAAGLLFVTAVTLALVLKAHCVYDSQRACSIFLGSAGAIIEVFISLWSSLFAIPLPYCFSRMVAAPFSKHYLLGALCLSCLSCVHGMKRSVSRCGVSLASMVSSLSWSFRFFRLGATIAVVLVLWQISFTGIRVGEASNPGPTMSI